MYKIKRNNKNKNRIIIENVGESKSYGTLVLSTIAILISLTALTWQIYSELDQKKERIEIFKINNAKNHTTEFTKGFPKKIAGFFTEEITIALANNSSNNISLISIEYNNIFENKSYKYNELVNMKENLPLNIPANSTINIDLTVKYFLTQNIYEILNKEFRSNSRPVYSSFKNYIYKNGFDLFGNIISYQEYGESYAISTSLTNSYQKIELILTTSKNNKFSFLIEPS